MRTVKRNPFLSGGCAILGGALLLAGTATADVTSDMPAGILVIPKLLYSSATDFTFSPLLKPPGSVLDTEIQITNTSDQEVKLRCFYVNANSHCSNDPERVCSTTADCQVGPPGPGGLCFEGWIEVDFEFTLTPYQPIWWKLSEGLFSLPLPQNTGNIPGANEDPFMGELKCVQVGPDDAPIAANDVKGEASIVTVSPSYLDARAYNALGILAITNDGDNTLILGGEEPEYNGCPSVVILDHFFDDAVEPINGDFVKTHLTCVPCSQNFEFQDVTLFDTTVQFLIFNEFEQRFSASRPLRCFREWELCALGTHKDRPFNLDLPDPQSGLPSWDAAAYSCQRSVFSAFVNGTLTGQTRIRGVDDGSDLHGNGLLCVAEEFYRTDPDDIRTTRSTTAFNLHQVGERATPDIIRLP
jgi:hypothetical protein